MTQYYKAWLESRVRFLASAVVFAAYCASFVHDGRRVFPPPLQPDLPYTVFVWRGIYNGIDTLLFVLVALLLGLGGLQRERALGTAGFTLALPATRVQLLMPRVAVGLMQVALLAATPAVLLPWVSQSVGYSYPAADAWKFAALFTATGVVWMSAGVFWSSVIVADSTGAVACILTPAIYVALVNGTALRRWPLLNVFNIMNGSRLPYLDAGTALLVGPFPWLAVVGVMCVAAALVGMSAAVVARTDF